ncbi:MAG: thioredoxin [Flavobacteriales bacterium]|nr:MAG: thioredoxin [Flavobacteriales bacterium]
MKNLLSNIITILLIVFIGLMIFVPSVKATLLSSLMKIGLFQPKIEQKVISKTPENLQIQLIQENGTMTQFQDLKNKVVLVSFWAKWCPSCLAEIPSINDLKTKTKDNNIVFILVDVDGNLQETNAYLQSKNIHLDNYAISSTIPQDWFQGTLPTTIVLNKNGDMVFQHSGTANYNTDEFLAFLKELAK